jgi:hypothetical protein
MAAGTIEQMTGDPPIILHEQPDRGRTIIEKLEDYARGATFVVVLLTTDERRFEESDQAESSGPSERCVRSRPLRWSARTEARRPPLRTGRRVAIGPPRRAVQGIDAGGAWRYELGRKMPAAGLRSDLNGLR